MIYDDHFFPYKRYALPSNTFEKLDLLISHHSQFYVKFSPLRPTDDKESPIRIERERLNTLYPTNAFPQDKACCKYMITKFSGFRMKILRKFDIGYILYYYYIYQNTQDKIKISNADFPSINMNDILVIAAHLKD